MTQIDKHAPAKGHRPPAGPPAKRKAESEGKRDHGPRRDDWRDDFADADKNHDGRLTRSELKIPRAERKVYDRNHNGIVSRREFRAAARPGGTLDRLDRNDDGHLSKRELKAGHRKAASRHGKAARPHHGRGHRHEPHEGLRHRRFDLEAPMAMPDAPAAPGAVRGDTELVISSFNVLGSSHTVPGRSEHPGMMTGARRIHLAADLLNQHQVDVVGFQEFQPDQVKEFQKIAGQQYALYPGMQLGRGPNVNSIAWRKSAFDLVKADTIKIPYFNGHEVKMPVVRLRDKRTGQEFYIANFHNPAFKQNERWRDEATRREVDLVNRLRRETGLPVFITGDMNERDEYHQKLTQGAPGMHASAAGAGRRQFGIDWIFASPNVTFTRHLRDRSAKVKQATDHPMIVSRARIRKNGG